jgi:hypothetical protein
MIIYKSIFLSRKFFYFLSNPQRRTNIAKLKESNPQAPVARAFAAPDIGTVDGAVPFELPVAVDVLFEPFWPEYDILNTQAYSSASWT